MLYTAELKRPGTDHVSNTTLKNDIIVIVDSKDQRELHPPVKQGI
jgi:hypothetical protein